MTPPHHTFASAAAAGQPALPRPLSVQECWTQLRRQHEGRLAYGSGRGPRHVVRPYAVHERAVVLRLPADGEAARYAEGRRVAFDVQERVDAGSVAAVEVVGRARVVDAEVPEGLADEGWPDDLGARVLVVEVDDLRGTRWPVAAPSGGGTR